MRARAVVPMVAAGAILITVVGTVLRWISSPAFGTEIDETVPMLLLLALVGGIGILLLLRSLSVIQSGENNDKDHDEESSNESRLSGNPVLDDKESPDTSNWNSRRREAEIRDIEIEM